MLLRPEGWSIMHFSQKLVPFVTVSVLIPVSVFSNVPLMREEGPCIVRQELNLFKSSLIGVWFECKQLLLSIRVLCFKWNMVSRCIQVLQCLYIMWLSYFTILNSAIPINSACHGWGPDQSLVIFFSWHPLAPSAGCFHAITQPVDSWCYVTLCTLCSKEQVSPLLFCSSQNQGIRSSVSPSNEVQFMATIEFSLCCRNSQEVWVAILTVSDT